MKIHNLAAFNLLNNFT